MNEAPNDIRGESNGGDSNGGLNNAQEGAAAHTGEPTTAEGGAPNSTAAADLEQLRGDVEKFKGQWMRAVADFDNFRKRSRREVDDAKRAGREELLRDLLPVFDNLERAIVSAQAATDAKAVAGGLTMVQRQFLDTLAKSGVKKVPGVGQPFDPSVHEAIQQVETSDHPPGTVMAEVQPGYMEGERLVRAAMVIVSKAPSGQDEAPSN
jgi:molecular chaperone GrpE